MRDGGVLLILLYVNAVTFLVPIHCFTNKVQKSWKSQYFISDLYLQASTSDSSVREAFLENKYHVDEAQSFINDKLMPSKMYSERIGWGRDAQGLGNDPGPLNPDDPRLSMTYAEFPLSSLDELVDIGIQYLPAGKDKNDPITMIDLGSGCGRIVLYLAMTRGSNEEVWDFHGIEVSHLLYNKGIEYLEMSLREDIFSPTSSQNSIGKISFELGPASDFMKLFGKADIIFAYSTAFSAKAFSTDLGALILDPEWSQLLSDACSPGCVAITTDRALDPKFGWQLAERKDVENSEVFGTTGYISVLGAS